MRVIAPPLGSGPEKLPEETDAEELPAPVSPVAKPSKPPSKHAPAAGG
jgi:hypothetical protein